MKTRTLWIILGVLALLSPLGLLATGDAWGEWGADAFESMIGYIPAGLAHFSDLWHAPLPDYTVPGTSEPLGYILSALAGILLVAGGTWGLGKWLARRPPR